MPPAAGASPDAPGDDANELDALVARLDALEAEVRRLAVDLLTYHQLTRGGVTLSKRRQEHFRRLRGRLERLISIYEAGTDLAELYRAL